MSVFFFKSVVQAVLLFGSEAWVVAPHMGRALVGFHDQFFFTANRVAPAAEN